MFSLCRHISVWGGRDPCRLPPPHSLPPGLFSYQVFESEGWRMFLSQPHQPPGQMFYDLYVLFLSVCHLSPPGAAAGWKSTVAQVVEHVVQ